MGKKIKESSTIRMQIIIIAALLFTIILIGASQQASITGAAIAGGQEWENLQQIIVDQTIETVSTHIVFEEYKPDNCADGIYIETDAQEISFTTENEVYENGKCIETDVIFNNIIYAPPEEIEELTTKFTIPMITGAVTAQQDTLVTITYYVYYGKIIEQPEEEPQVEEKPIVKEELEEEPIITEDDGPGEEPEQPEIFAKN